jgi:hypothetical protein
MKTRHLVMAAALIGTGALVVFGDRTPDSGVAEAVERKPARSTATVVTAVAAPTQGGQGAAAVDPAILRLAPRATLIGNSDEAMGASADVFGRRDWNPPPPPPAAATSQEKAPPPPPPSAPPLPFIYLGKAAEGGSWEVFLAIGDKTYIAREKMVIDGIYRVDAITPPTLSLTYLPLNQVQQLNIGVLD